MKWAVIIPPFLSEDGKFKNISANILHQQETYHNLGLTKSGTTAEKIKSILSSLHDYAPSNKTTSSNTNILHLTEQPKNIYTPSKQNIERRVPNEWVILYN